MRALGERFDLRELSTLLRACYTRRAGGLRLDVPRARRSRRRAARRDALVSWSAMRSLRARAAGAALTLLLSAAAAACASIWGFEDAVDLSDATDPALLPCSD